MVEFVLAVWFLQAVSRSEKPAVCAEKLRGEAVLGALAEDAFTAARGGFGAMAAKGEESWAAAETKRSVTLLVKLVRRDGEIPFAGTQDSAPSKNRSAVSQAADRLARKLVREVFPAPPSPLPEGRYQKIQ